MVTRAHYWRLWIRDTHARPFERDRVRTIFTQEFQRLGLRVDGGPDRVFDTRGDRAGEWSFSIADHNGTPLPIFERMVIEVLARHRFSLRKPPDQLGSASGEAATQPLRVVR